MYNITIVSDEENIDGDISLVEEIVECYTDNPIHFVNKCQSLKIGEQAKYSDYINDLIIVRRVA